MTGAEPPPSARHGLFPSDLDSFEALAVVGVAQELVIRSIR